MRNYFLLSLLAILFATNTASAQVVHTQEISDPPIFLHQDLDMSIPDSITGFPAVIHHDICNNTWEVTISCETQPSVPVVVNGDTVDWAVYPRTLYTVHISEKDALILMDVDVQVTEITAIRRARGHPREVSIVHQQ